MRGFLLCIFLCGCAAKEVPVFYTPKCPPRPALVAVPAKDLSPLSDDTYRLLVLRELALRSYIWQLEVNCEQKDN